MTSAFRCRVLPGTIALAALLVVGCGSTGGSVGPRQPGGSPAPSAALAPGEPAKSPDAQATMLYPVWLDDSKTGYIDRNGKMVIEPQFESGMEFREGRAVVWLDGEVGMIDATGKILFRIKADDLGEMHDGLAAFSRNDRIGYVDATGREVIAPKSEWGSTLGVTEFAFSDGRAAYWEGEKSGFIDKTGKVVIEPKYIFETAFSEGLAGVYEGTFEAPKNPGFIGPDGTMVIRGIVPDGPFSEGLAAARQGNKVGYVDKAGKWVIEPRFQRGSPFVNGYAYAVEGDKLGFIDKTGQWVVKPQFVAFIDSEEYVAGTFQEGLAWARLPDGGAVYVKPDGSRAFDRMFESANDFSGGLAMVFADDGGQMYIDTTGKVVWEQPKPPATGQ